jgi:hypothetical protein
VDIDQSGLPLHHDQTGTNGDLTMTIQNMTIFITDALENQALANELVSVVGDKEGAAANQAVAELAQSKGYDVTIEDAAALSESALTAGTDGELSDADLDGVSGGLGGFPGNGIGNGILQPIFNQPDILPVPSPVDFFKQW